MDMEELHQELDTAALELAYEKCLHQQHTIQEAERHRRLRVQLLLLEYHNDNLQAQIADDNDYVQRMEQNQDALRVRFTKAETSLETTQGELRIKNREIETLKAELSSLHRVTIDSNKLLTEKLALARELSTLRPEVDHLRSEVASNQSLLAQKLSLDHQVRTLEVQLDTEKKSTQRILDKEGKARSEDAKLESQLQTVQAELNRERREKRIFELEAQEASRIWEAQKVALESRLDSLKNKLRTTKESMKQTQQELSIAGSVPRDLANGRTTSAHGRITATKSRKRTATQMLSDSIIGTPGNATDGKRTKRVSTLPGDKSEFSITPYLNRAASVVPGSSPEAITTSLSVAGTGEQPDGAQVRVEIESNDHQAASTDHLKSETKGALGTSTASKTNKRVGPGRNKPKTASVLEEVAEEENDENNQIQGGRSKATGPTTDDDTTLRVFGVKKQRRKLLGKGLSKTLFDEDDREIGTAGLGTTTFRALARPNNKLLPVASSVPGNGFGAFSPLKRNRQASAT
ncbi:MAG: hypothetical protein Q9178_007725 [Gyalolechia marmorata]